MEKFDPKTDNVDEVIEKMDKGEKRKVKKWLRIVSAVIILFLALFLYFRYFFVYSTGINAGEINYFQREGVIFKTYEGKMIQSGFRSGDNASNTSGGLRSNEFKFSVTDDAVAQKLMRSSGRHAELRWKRYVSTLPWRGNSVYIVTEVVSVE